MVSLRSVLRSVVVLASALLFVSPRPSASSELCWNCAADLCFYGMLQGFTGCRGGGTSGWCTIVPFDHCGGGEPDFSLSGTVLAAEGSPTYMANDGTVRSMCGDWVVGVVNDSPGPRAFVI